MACPKRLFPLRQPKNHRPPIPRWQLKVPQGVDRLFTAYVGVQQHNTDPSTVVAKEDATSKIRAWLTVSDRPQLFESFTVVEGDDVQDSDVWVCYWTEATQYEKSLERLRLQQIQASLTSPGREFVGLWCERFITAVSRLETNYSGLDYLPGVARIPGSEVLEHTLSAYWGAARDRIPESAYDRFERDSDIATAAPSPIPVGIGQHIFGTNYENLVHIRSGQFWENCDSEECQAYEEKLEPTLRDGLTYLWQNHMDTGTVGLRYLRNTCDNDPAELIRKETCGAGFFRSLADLEHWAERHKSHLSIYLGAIRHAKTFGDARKFRTWHEVSILKRGEARFEYVNCLPCTGSIQFIRLDQIMSLKAN